MENYTPTLGVERRGIDSIDIGNEMYLKSIISEIMWNFEKGLHNGKSATYEKVEENLSDILTDGLLVYVNAHFSRATVQSSVISHFGPMLLRQPYKEMITLKCKKRLVDRSRCLEVATQ